MRRGSITRLKFNIAFIILYLLFLLSFPFFRNHFNIKENIETANIGTAGGVLHLADRSTNSISGLFKNISNYFSFKKTLISEIEDLKFQLEVEKDKNILREEVVDNAGEVTIARKIFSDFTGIYDTILLDKGSAAGVESGDIVFLYPNRIIGRVDDVDAKRSVVTLYSKDKNKLEGVIRVVKLYDKVVDTTPLITSTSSSDIASSTADTESHIETVKGRPSSIIVDVYGYGGGDFIAKIPENLEVATGTIVYLGEDETKMIGEVVKAEKQDASFFQILLIRGYYNTRENSSYYIKHK